MALGCFECSVHFSFDPLRDGGLYGWISVLGLFASKMANGVLLKGLGMMLPTLQQQFLTSTWLIGWMVAFVGAGVYLTGKHDQLLGYGIPPKPPLFLS